MKKAAFLILLSLLASCAVPMPPVLQRQTAPRETTPHEMTQHYAWTLFQVTERGLYSVEMDFEDKINELRIGENSFDIIIHDANDKDITGTSIKAEVIMPIQKKSSLLEPKVSEVGQGRYTIGNIHIPEAGHWQVIITIGTGAARDKAVFNFPDMKGVSGKEAMAGHGMAMVPEKDLDLAPMKLTAAGRFMVHYQSEEMPFPLNKIHSWIIKLTTADGKPVPVAIIEIEGSMPEHGHGLPTKPEVGENLGHGSYRIEGMKFQMPGWWEVKLNIKTAYLEDTVTFNLIVK